MSDDDRPEVPDAPVPDGVDGSAAAASDDEPDGAAAEEPLGEPGQDLADALADGDSPAVWNETVWTAAHLGTEPAAHVIGACVLTRSFAPFELSSLLVAIDELSGVRERASFVVGERSPLRQVEVSGPDGGRRLVADVGTRVAVERDDGAAIVVAEVPADALAGVIVTVTAADAALAAALHDELGDAVAAQSSQWRKRAIAVNPYVLGMLERRSPGDGAGGGHEAPLDPGGAPERTLRREVIDPVLAWDRVGRVAGSRHVLVSGRPGSGKSTLLDWLEAELAGKVTTVRASPRVWLHPDLVRATFELATTDAPTLLVVDDLDLAIGGAGAGPGAEALVELADQLGATRRRGLALVATASNPASLEPTFGLRSGRFDVRIDLGAAASGFRRAWLEAALERHDVGGDAALLDRLVARTADRTPGELVELERIAVLESARTGDPVDLLRALDPGAWRGDPADGSGTYL